MFNGSVNFVASIRGNGITFGSIDFNPNVAGVDRVTMEVPNPGDRILSVVHLTNVATQDDGRQIAQKVVTEALNRIAYHHGIAIESCASRATSSCSSTPASTRSAGRHRGGRRASRGRHPGGGHQGRA